MNGFTKAIKLEYYNMLERKYSLLFYLIMPILIIWTFYITATTKITWTNYANLNITLYDLYASDVFSIIVLFITTQLMVLRIVGERAPYGTLDRELIAISRTGMYFGKFMANLIYVFIQTLLVFLCGYYLFPARNYGYPIFVFLFIFLIGIFGLISGLTISVFSRSKEQAVQFVPFYILILMLLSGILIPLDQMPTQIESFAEYFPLTLGADSLKQLTLDGVGFEDVTNHFIVLLIWISGIVILGGLKFYLEKKK